MRGERAQAEVVHRLASEGVERSDSSVRRVVCEAGDRGSVAVLRGAREQTTDVLLRFVWCIVRQLMGGPSRTPFGPGNALATSWRTAAADLVQRSSRRRPMSPNARSLSFGYGRGIPAAMKSSSVMARRSQKPDATSIKVGWRS